MKRKRIRFNYWFIILFTICTPIYAQQTSDLHNSGQYQLDNPMSVKYLKKHLRKSQPRLVLNSEIEKDLRKKLKTDPLIQKIYATIKYNAEKVLTEEPVVIKISDNPNSQKNQLGISRRVLYRINMLGMVYRIDKDQRMLQRINKELLAVCNAQTWNPNHFLDVGEMSLAVALALDWTAGKLPKSTIKLAQKSLIEKGINTSWPEDGSTPYWVNAKYNWNQVCNAGMIAASIAVAELEPKLAAKTIKRSLDGMNHALNEYAPHGVYPEGLVYWGYGTAFTAVTAAMLESAFETDFGIAEYPGLLESGTFRLMAESPTKRLFNYGDCSEHSEEYGDFTFSWLASKTGNSTYFMKEKFMRSPKQNRRIFRLAGAGLVWTAQYEEEETTKLPTNWKGDGPNPIVIFTGGENNTNGYYFAGKGGRGTVNHGNMDGGSFVFELNGVRWVVDPGNQGYGQLERIGFDLWSDCQYCDRWELFSKNNFGHSTISVNNELHVADGLATIINFSDGEKPEATINLSPAFEGLLKNANRRFVKDSDASIIIEDNIEVLAKTKWITWQLMTTANVEIVDGGAILKQDGKSLKLENQSHPEYSVSVVSLYPAPLKIDKQVKGLKRIEIRIPAYAIKDGSEAIKVRLSGD